MTRTSLRKVGTLAAAAGTAAAITTGVWSAPAAAATTYTRDYVAIKEAYSKPLKRCVRTTLWGSISFKHGMRQGGTYIYHTIKVHNPTMRVSALKKCGKTATSTLTKASLTQRMYEARCDASVRVSAGFRWSIAVSPTIHCGRFKTANRKTSYSLKAKTYTQYNSGRPVYFKGFAVDHGAGKPSKPLCLGIQPTVTAYVSSSSDSWTPSMKACVRR